MAQKRAVKQAVRFSRKRAARPGEGRPQKRAEELREHRPGFYRLHLALPVELVRRVDELTPRGGRRSEELVRLVTEAIEARVGIEIPSWAGKRG